MSEDASDGVVACGTEASAAAKDAEQKRLGTVTSDLRAGLANRMHCNMEFIPTVKYDTHCLIV